MKDRIWNKFTEIHFRDVIEDKIEFGWNLKKKKGFYFSFEMARKDEEKKLQLVYCIEMLKFPLHIKYWATVILL